MGGEIGRGSMQEKEMQGFSSWKLEYSQILTKYQLKGNPSSKS